mmetsp:Transcript_18173/g.45899  ORF Transcript_18173/g.45899 Transcript_18173/m.45899 type:complete len:85 (+) Transcript_18173:29-283(+)
MNLGQSWNVADSTGNPCGAVHIASFMKGLKKKKKSEGAMSESAVAFTYQHLSAVLSSLDSRASHDKYSEGERLLFKAMISSAFY